MSDAQITDEMQREMDHDKTKAEIAKLMAETAKINSENKLYPLVVGSGATLAIVAIVKLFL